MTEVIVIAAIVLAAMACCYGLYRWWSRAGEPEERLDPAARRAVKDAQAHEADRWMGPGSGASL